MSNSVGFWKRFFALLLDSLIISLPLIFISYMVTGEWEQSSLTSTIDILYVIIIPIVWYGYTIGKKLMGIRIVRVDGEKLGIGTMLLRQLVGGILYAFTFGIAIIVSAFMIGLRSDNRSLHDLIAGTYVTSETP
jgi:uncharacterized RDD family membrane protein YckC